MMEEDNQEINENGDDGKQQPWKVRKLERDAPPSPAVSEVSYESKPSSVTKRKCCPARKSTKGGWSSEEDDILTRAVRRYNGKNWKKIAELIPGHTDVQCLHRWKKVLDPNLVKGAWTKEEDDAIIELVKIYGSKKWSEISKSLPGRIGKQCRERWHNHLSPGIKKDPWTEHEEMDLIQAHQIYGNKWAEISKFLPGRTDNSIKNHWNCSLKNRAHAFHISRPPNQSEISPFIHVFGTESSNNYIKQQSGCCNQTSIAEIQHAHKHDPKCCEEDTKCTTSKQNDLESCFHENSRNPFSSGPVCFFSMEAKLPTSPTSSDKCFGSIDHETPQPNGISQPESSGKFYCQQKETPSLCSPPNCSLCSVSPVLILRRAAMTYKNVPSILRRHRRDHEKANVESTTPSSSVSCTAMVDTNSESDEVQKHKVRTEAVKTEQIQVSDERTRSNRLSISCAVEKRLEKEFDAAF